MEIGPLATVLLYPIYEVIKAKRNGVKGWEEWKQALFKSTQNWYDTERDTGSAVELDNISTMSLDEAETQSQSTASSKSDNEKH